MENQENTASRIEEITNKAQLLGVLPGPQKYYVQFLTANPGMVGSLGDLIQKIEHGTATRNDYIDVAKDILAIGTATVGMVNPKVGLILGGVGIAMSILDYADSKNYDMSVMYNETLSVMIDYAKNNSIDDVIKDVSEFFRDSINSITNTKSSSINKESILHIENNLNYIYNNNLIDSIVYKDITRSFSDYYVSSITVYTPLVNNYFTPINIGAFYESSTSQEVSLIKSKNTIRFYQANSKEVA